MLSLTMYSFAVIENNQIGVKTAFLIGKFYVANHTLYPSKGKWGN